MRKNIGITGGIGAGKTFFMERLFKKLPDVNWFSVDDEVRRMYLDPIWREYLKETYGTCDKRKISEMAFADPAVLKDLMAQSSDYLETIIKRWTAPSTSKVVNLIEFPLLFEFNFEKRFDFIIHITAPTEVRIKRVMERDGKTQEQVEAVIACQISEEEKSKRSDFILDTSIYPISDEAKYDLMVSSVISLALHTPNLERPACVKAL